MPEQEAKISRFGQEEKTRLRAPVRLHPKGYLYTEGKKYSFLNLKNFNEVCGSCIIIKPDLIELLIDDLLYFNHERTIVNNEKLKPLPFPGAVYSMLNGNNIRLDKKELKNRT